MCIKYNFTIMSPIRCSYFAVATYYLEPYSYAYTKSYTLGSRYRAGPMRRPPLSDLLLGCTHFWVVLVIGQCSSLLLGEKRPDNETL